MCFFVGEVILPLTSGRTDRADILGYELISKRSRNENKNKKRKRQEPEGSCIKRKEMIMSTNPNNANQNVRESLLSDIEATKQAIVELSDEQLEQIAGGAGGGLEHKWNSLVRGSRYVGQQTQNVASNVYNASGY
jgi:hypothetical protein